MLGYVCYNVSMNERIQPEAAATVAMPPTRWRYCLCSVMITRWRYCLSVAMITRWHYYIDAVMITRRRYCLNAVMITRWQYCLNVEMITKWHYCISVEMVTGWVDWIVNLSNCKELRIARRKLQHLQTAGKDH